MTPKEKLFCAEYLIDLNAVQAAIRAGYAVSTAQGASKWIHPEHPEKPKLRARVDQLMAERSARTGINADRVLRELARIGFAVASNVVDPRTGALLTDVPEDDAAAVASVRVKQGEDWVEREVKLHDKARALELLGKHLNLFTDNISVTAHAPIIVRAADGSVEVNEGAAPQSKGLSRQRSRSDLETLGVSNLE